MCVRILHTHCLMNILVNSFKLKATIELNSISMSKNDPKITKLDKYDVEANLDEVENTEDVSVYKYGFTALSNPKNVRLSIEGIAKNFGDSIERSEILEKDEHDVPKILTIIYHELFPTFFLLSKTLNVSCPPHQIGAMGETVEKETEMNKENLEVSDENETTENESTPETSIESETETTENESTPETSIESETDIDDSEEKTADVVQSTV